MKNKKLSVKELQENIKTILRRPVSDKDIEAFNKIVERDDEHDRKHHQRTPNKIAKLPEVDQ